MDKTPRRTVLRADFAAYRRWFGKPVHGLPLLLALVGGGLASAVRRGDGALLFLLLLGTIVAVLGFLAIHIATSRVVLTADRIESRRWFARTRLRLDDDLVGILAELRTSPVGRTSQVLVLRARSGGRRVRLNGAYWDFDDLLRIAQVAGARVIDHEVLTPKELERLAPGSMPWRTLHPWACGFAGTAVGFAVIVGGVVAWWDVHGLPPFDESPPCAVSPGTVAAQDSLVASLERTMGGEWENPEVRLDTCKDVDGYKGWSRRVSVQPRQIVVEDTGEDAVVTPIRPAPELIDAIDRTMTDAGHPELFFDRDEVAAFDANGYLQLLSLPEDDGPGTVTVRLTFSGEQGYASISVDSPCESPRSQAPSVQDGAPSSPTISNGP